jgi:hypothetical protein
LSTYGKESFEGIYDGRPFVRGPKGRDGYGPVISPCLGEVCGVQSSGAIGHQTNEVADRVATLRVANKVNFVIPVPRPVAKV